MRDPVPEIHSVPLSDVNRFGHELYVVRGDLTHPEISGNKWYKLKYNLRSARETGVRAVLSFGGAHSNHLHALAAAGREYGLDTLGVVRGDWRTTLTATLQDAVSWGMRLIPISNTDYRNRNDRAWVSGQLSEWLCRSDVCESGFRPEEVMVIPEGGSNLEGVRGVRDWARAIYSRFADPVTLVMPVGSGGTIAGFAAEASPHQVMGISVVKDDSRPQYVNRLLLGVGEKQSAWEIVTGFEGKGYGKWSHDLVVRLNDVYAQTEVPLEPVYSGKAFQAMTALAEAGRITTKQIVFVHTGGLQGGRSVPELRWL
ncbi:1-aminocyclopropane-1-carboxylate deaminase/D-cysteine desulfhydrase [Hahella sp. CCB-MM4]|uniref:1-aminocyclopropane-1-carboxylate deaminase/D-cysteine desulfhydrase n=1 Tax=Hahella sp. (strain CCB-MM4) TaxID=1926491 RepID=UPI00143DEBA0|nr:pyridoxal-phosphate dependent enzyme [Hahella sp. CCB-MM4]